METPIHQFISQYSNNFTQDDAFMSELKKHVAVVSYPKHHILLRENHAHDFAYFVVTGAVRSYYLKEGVEVNTWFAFEKDIVGSLHTYRNLPSRETVALVENSTLISINLKTLKPLAETNLPISLFIGSIIEEYAIFLEERIFASQFKSSIERYESLLKQEPAVLKRISLTHIASYIGISRETLSRLRSR